jgi:acetoin utilization deacetylase AcuC-like enzyme
MPFHIEAASSWTMNSWDRTQIPKPFTTVALAIGEPLYVPRDAGETALEEWRQELQQSLADCKHTQLRQDRLIMPLVLVSSKRFVDHVTPAATPSGRARRSAAGRRGVLQEQGGEVIDPRSATDEDLLRVHTQEHVDAIVATRGKATMIDEDTFTSPDSDEIARLAAGAVLTESIARSMAGGSRALVLVRPPGHHAEADRAMGFCLYSNIAVGAAYARSRGCARVAIVDYDVHHGNGTQWIFYEDPTVLLRVVASIPVLSRHRRRVGEGQGRRCRLHAQHPARGRRQGR